MPQRLVRIMSGAATGRGVSHGEDRTSHELAVGRQKRRSPEANQSSRICGRLTRRWPQTGMWEITPAKSPASGNGTARQLDV